MSVTFVAYAMDMLYVSIMRLTRFWGYFHIIWTFKKLKMYEKRNPWIRDAVVDSSEEVRELYSMVRATKVYK